MASRTRSTDRFFALAERAPEPAEVQPSLAGVPDLRLTSKERTQRLTDAETVKLGRLLTHFLPTDHVWYPEDTDTVVVVARDQSEPLAPPVHAAVAEILGDFEESFDG